MQEETRSELYYLLHRFLRYYFSNPLSLGRIEDKDSMKDATECYCECFEKDYAEKPVNFAETEKTIRFLRSANAANEKTIKQYKIIKNFLITNDITSLYTKIILLLYEFFEFYSDEMSAPVRKALFENFGYFFTNLCKGESKKTIMGFLVEREAIINQIITLSIRMALTRPENVDKEITDVLKDTEENFDLLESVEGSVFDGYEKISKIRFDVEPEIFEKVKDVEYLPYYFSLDADYTDTLIGNIVIIRDKKDISKTVEYLIINRMHFSSYRRMFETINPKKFGFRRTTPKKLEEECGSFFAEISNGEGALALTVIKY